MSCAVHDGGFIEFIGNRGLDVRSGHHEVPYRDKIDENHDSPGIVQTQVTDIQEDRDEAAREEHGECDRQVHQGFSRKLSGQRIGGCNRNDDAQEGTAHSIKDAVHIAVPQLTVLEDRLIAHQGKVHGPEEDTSGQHRVRIRDGGNDDQPERIEDNKENQQPENQIDDIEDPVRMGFADARGMLFRHVCLPPLRTG